MTDHPALGAAWRDLLNHPEWRAAADAAAVRWNALMMRPAPERIEAGDAEAAQHLIEYLRRGVDRSPLERLRRVCTGDCAGVPNARDLIDGGRVDVRRLGGALDLAVMAAVAPELTRELGNRMDALRVARSVYQHELTDPALAAPVTLGQLARSLPAAEVPSEPVDNSAVPPGNSADTVPVSPPTVPVGVPHVPPAEAPLWDRVSEMLAQGLSVREIAGRLSVGKSTIGRMKVAIEARGVPSG